MTPEETQQMHRDELLAQLTNHPNKKLRLLLFVYDRGKEEYVELEFTEVKFEDDEIIVELENK